MNEEGRTKKEIGMIIGSSCAIIVFVILLLTLCLNLEKDNKNNITSNQEITINEKTVVTEK